MDYGRTLWLHERPNLCTVGIEEGEEMHVKVKGNIFNKIIPKNFKCWERDAHPVIGL
jgi:hypothetical protein